MSGFAVVDASLAFKWLVRESIIAAYPHNILALVCQPKECGWNLTASSPMVDWYEQGHRDTIRSTYLRIGS